MHLLAIELNLGRHSLELSEENSADERRIRAAMQSEVRIEEILKIRNVPTSPQAQGERHKEDLNTTNNCAGSFDEDRLTSEDDMKKGTTGKQFRKFKTTRQISSPNYSGNYSRTSRYSNSTAFGIVAPTET